MNQQPQKSVAPLVLGILSIITSLLITYVGIVLGVIGLSLGARKNSNEPDNDYKVPIILNIIGIVVGILNAIAGVVLFMLHNR